MRIKIDDIPLDRRILLLKKLDFAGHILWVEELGPRVLFKSRVPMVRVGYIYRWKEYTTVVPFSLNPSSPRHSTLIHESERGQNE